GTPRGGRLTRCPPHGHGYLISFPSAENHPLTPPQELSRPRRCLLAALRRDLPVHNYILDARRVLSGLFIGRAVGYRLRIEDHDVGGEALAQLAPFRQLHAARRKRGHLAHPFLQREQALLADVCPKHAREGAVEPRMRFAGRRWYAVRPDHAQRVGEDPPHVRLVHHEEDGHGAWVRLEHSLRGFIGRNPQPLGDLSEGLTLV